MQDVSTADASPDQRLAALREKIRADLEVISHPRMEWLSPRQAPDGTNALDVLIVGAGQSGIATAFGLKRARVEKVVVVDRAERGREGPWLTYRSWYTARFGEQSWRDLDLIRREDWADYLLWLRDTVALAVRNGVEVTAIRDAGDLIEVHATTGDGRA
jgi:cation diffusion facilitator CzcD-associated flavoprotein CzcO